MQQSLNAVNYDANTTRTLMNACIAGLLIGVFGITGVVRADDQSPGLARQADDGSIRLEAADAKIEGPNARLEGGDKKKGVIWWTSVDTSLHWAANAREPGNYRVELNYSLF